MTQLQNESNNLEQRIRAPLILEIKGNSLDDGPGIRTVVFFKGCPLSCVWCHNPESKKTGLEISFDEKACIGCDTCIGICKENALSRTNPHFIDRSRCSLCLDCIDACPSGALSRVGLAMSIDYIVNKVIADKPFFDNSGGGVTLSGGEPALFMDFIADLLMKLKDAGIHTLMETCGLFNFDAFVELVLPHIDMIFFDVKLFDAEDHRRFCGIPNEQILKNFERLLAVASRHNKVVLPRIPLIPGITDTDANIQAIALYLKGLGVQRADILSYNPLWFEKCSKIGIDAPFQTDKAKKTWISTERLQRAKDIFFEHGIGVA
jgi:pyruvate formate lyase activating enzyme